MAEKKGRPGVMIYFDSIRPALNRMDDAQCGALFRALIDYAEHGIAPKLDPLSGMAFDLLAPKIDRDAEKYEESREQRQYAVYTREVKKKGEQPLSIAEWRLSHLSETSGRYRPITSDNGPYLSIPTSPAEAPYIVPTTSIHTTTTGEVEGEGCKGEGDGEPQRLYADWIASMNAGDKRAALSISNRLYSLGYVVDVQSRELTRRRS